MSKYMEACNAYATSREKSITYVHACCEFATYIANGIAEHFEWPRNQIFFVRDDQLGKRSPQCSREFVQLDGHDGYVHFTIDVELYTNPNTRARGYRLGFRMKMKKIEDYFSLNIKGSPRDGEFMLNRDSGEELTKFYERLFEKMKWHFNASHLDLTIRDVLEDDE